MLGPAGQLTSTAAVVRATAAAAHAPQAVETARSARMQRALVQQPPQRVLDLTA